MEYANQEDYGSAIHFLKKSAEKGNIAALNNVGIAYEKMGNLKESLVWIKKAAAKKDSCALRNLALAYLNGNGVRKNYRLALKYIEESADLGYTPALWTLGGMYEKGIGVKKDLKFAIELYKLGAKHETEFCDCSRTLAYCYKHGDGVRKNRRMAFKYFLKAAEKENVDGLYEVGYSYLTGTGVEKDIDKGIEYLCKAAKQNDIDSIITLRIFFHNDKEYKDRDTALHWVYRGEELNEPMSILILAMMNLKSSKPEKIAKAKRYLTKFNKHIHEYDDYDVSKYETLKKEFSNYTFWNEVESSRQPISNNKKGNA